MWSLHTSTNSSHVLQTSNTNTVERTQPRFSAGLKTLSNRAIENVQGVDYWEPLVAALGNPWSKSNPDGMALLGVAENSLMHAELERHIRDNFAIDRSEHFSYGHGPQGSPRLRKALAQFFNTRFQPRALTTDDEFTITTGVTALIDHLTWSVCDPGEGILFPQPLYAGFTNDLPTRARGKLVPVPFARGDGSHHLDDVFDPDANMRCFERAYHKSLAEGVKVKGVMITNPHNPLGKCYSVETIKAIARFCAKYNLHYLSDEIYAMSVFENAAYPNANRFSSVLSVELDGIIDPLMVHVLYGMAKDFCANGLRLGSLHTRNYALRAAVSGIAAFGWDAYLVQDMWARILEDQPFVEYFLSENAKRLATRYAEVTSWLRDQGIRFYEGGNAGVFLWLDLRELFRKKRSGTASLLVSAPSFPENHAKEVLLGSRWWASGVMVSKGTGYLTEEFGWFRIVFTVEEECLRVGLARLREVLHAVRASGKL